MLSPSKPPRVGQNALSAEPGMFSRLHRTSVESVSPSGRPGGGWTVLFDDDSNVEQQNAPSPLKVQPLSIQRMSKRFANHPLIFMVA